MDEKKPFKREPWHVLIELRDISKSLDEFASTKPMELLAGVYENPSPIVIYVSAGLWQRIEKSKRIPGIGQTTIRELALGTLRNTGKGSAADEIQRRLTSLFDTLDKWELYWRPKMTLRSRAPKNWLAAEQPKALRELEKAQLPASELATMIRQIIVELEPGLIHQNRVEKPVSADNAKKGKNKMPKSQKLIDICAYLDAKMPPGGNADQYARDFCEQNRIDISKAKNLLRGARRYPWLWKQ